MKESVVTYLTNEDRVCLGLKKFGYSKGKWNGFGGKIEKGESPQEAAVREVLEESGVEIQISDLNQVAIFYYHEPQGDWNVIVFLCNKFEGTPKESKEMKPEWFDTNNLPLNNMWKNDSLWLKRLLSGNKLLRGEFWHDKNGKVIKYELSEVDGF